MGTFSRSQVYFSQIFRLGDHFALRANLPRAQRSQPARLTEYMVAHIGDEGLLVR